MRKVMITVGGKSRSLSDWAREAGLTKQTLHNRIHNLGWSPERAVTEPAHKNVRRLLRRFEYKGKWASTAEWARRYGIPVERLRQRLLAGWSIDEAINRPAYGPRR